MGQSTEGMITQDNQKELIIKAITERIKDEQKKHERNIPNWHEIAARKIYASFNITLKQD
jgi:hypothetical protein